VAALNSGEGWAAGLVTVRVNDWTTPWTYQDVIEVVGQAGAHIDALVLPKCAGPDQVKALDYLLTQVEANAGLPVEVFLLTEALKGDALANLEALRKLGGAVRPFSSEKGLGVQAGDVVVDAVFGTGLTRPPEGSAAQAIEAMLVAHSLGARVIACDIPSGVDADTGAIMGGAVRAHRTVVMGLPKPACVLTPGCTYFGDITILDIGLPDAVMPRG